MKTSLKEVNKKMEKTSPIFELNRFQDGRIMLRVRFFGTSNFWIHDSGTATWVPTKAEAENLKEFLDVIDEYNEFNRTLERESNMR